MIEPEGNLNWKVAVVPSGSWYDSEEIFLMVNREPTGTFFQNKDIPGVLAWGSEHPASSNRLLMY
jgi:hypothetical protein